MVAMLCLVACIPCKADSRYLIDVWTPYDGLPQSRALSIAQTPDGYLWIATQLGWLARFDGIRFKHFNSDNTPVLGSPEIHKLIVDDRGTLWICDINGRMISYKDEIFRLQSGLNPGYSYRVTEWIGRHENELRFTSKSGHLLRLSGERTLYENHNNPQSPAEDSIRQFCQENDGQLWCCKNNGTVGRWENDAFQEESLPPGTHVNHLTSAAEGGMWLALTDGLMRYQNGRFQRVPLHLSTEFSHITHIAQSPDQSLWLLTGGGLVMIRDGRIVHLNPLADIDLTAQLRPLELYVDSQGGAWVVKFGGGVWHVDARGNPSSISSRNGLPSDQIEAWFEDREKNIWLGTSAGLVRLRPRWFQLIETQAEGTGTGVASISEDKDGAIWLGCANGVTRWKENHAETIHLPPFRVGFPVADITVAPGSFPGEMWLGSVQSGAMLLRDGVIEHPFPFHAPGVAIRVVRRDPQGGIWFGGEFGLYRWDGSTLRKFGPQDGLKPGHIHDICFDAEGTPWIAKAEDLIVVYRNERFETIPLPGVSKDIRIYTLLCGKSGDIWFGTVGGGLYHYTAGKLLRYTEEDGLPGNSVSQLLEDDAGHLWGGTHRGIFRVSTTALDMRAKGVRPQFLFHTYGHSDGLPSAECSGGFQPACWKASDGQLWFSTAIGAVRIDPKQVKKNIYPPAMVIERMRVNDQDVPFTRAHQDSAKLVIEPGHHRYLFDFTGLSLTAPAKVGFQWRMSGVDTDWVDGQRQRSATYSGLPPGNYQFAVRGRNNDGVWSLEPAVLSFRVEPFFWQRPLVVVGFIIATMAAIHAMATLWMRRKHLRELRHLEFERTLEQQRFHHKQAMGAERARIAAELHDDLGANLTQIQWLGDAAHRGQDPSSAENEILSRISSKSREVIRLMDEIVWAVNPKNDTLEQLVSYVCNFAEQYFRDSPTRARIDVAGNIPPHSLEADIRHHLFLIAKEAFHNVAKHAHTDRVWIRISVENDIFQLSIEDHGAGFDTHHTSDGDGLANMKRRAEQAGASLQIESTSGQGTCINLSLPLIPPHS